MRYYCELTAVERYVKVLREIVDGTCSREFFRRAPMRSIFSVVYNCCRLSRAEPMKKTLVVVGRPETIAWISRLVCNVARVSR